MAAINGFARVPGRDLLLVESALSVFAVRESVLHARGGKVAELDFERLPCIARTPEYWSISGESRSIWVLDDAKLYRGSLELPFGDLDEIGLEPVESTLAAGDGIIGVAASADGSRLLLQVTTGDDPAYELHVVRSFDPASGNSAELAEMEGIDRFGIQWSEASRSFVIANVGSERIMTWDGVGTNGTVLVDLEREEPDTPLFPEGARLSEATLRPRGESLMLSLRDEDLGRFYVATLPLLPDAPPASRTPPLPPGNFFGWAWRDDDPLGACIRETDAAVSVCLVSARGGVAAEFELPSSWSVNCLAWSEDESRVYIGTEHCIGVWDPRLAG